MTSTLPATLIELVYDALLKSFWRKEALKRFLRQSGISDSFIAQLDPQEIKRQWLDRLFPKLQTSERGRAIISAMAKALAEQTSFPDLEKWEDAAEKIQVARNAVQALRYFLGMKSQAEAREKEEEDRRRKAAEAREKSFRSQTDLKKLKDQLEFLFLELGTQEAGYKFQTWFYDFLDYEDIDNRRPYVSAGRQIDGSITLDGTTYLVELKFTSAQSDATDIDSVLAKVNTKADNTMGVVISISGYSSVAVDQASFAKSPLLLLDSKHIYMVLSGISRLSEVLRRVRRHSSQTGIAYLDPNDFGG